MASAQWNYVLQHKYSIRSGVELSVYLQFIISDITVRVLQYRGHTSAYTAHQVSPKAI